jgi:hypothetical protein
MSSGGALSAPTEGTSFFIVDVVFVRCGFSGFDFWISPCASEFAWRLSIVLSAEPGEEVERKRDVDFEPIDIGPGKSVARSGTAAFRRL